MANSTNKDPHVADEKEKHIPEPKASPSEKAEKPDKPEKGKDGGTSSGSEGKGDKKSRD